MAKAKIRKTKKTAKERERAELMRRFAKAVRSETTVRVKEVNRA